MPDRHWKITGYDGTQVTFERLIPGSEAEIIRVLQRLASRHLNDEEVVLSSLRKNSKGYLSHLEIQRNSGGALTTTGSGHWYTATVPEGP
jgi:hypothetical protein